ncbi:MULTISPECIES: hypothetical protein [Coprobacillaceae]|uniref:hypothetical protein n=1 Tax=Coprobacillaceae TaxID=2810280 RepID=UPI000E544335|nr:MULTISPECIES: hypothetical protein [Coprobacillaceae]RHM62156.1 hypothetical protein DWZ53_03785 [Coprobacillus sp. AF33-1AC]RHS96033.1 hypothetical protein DW911_01480 [Erysipelatoclostridium sp. AM42-17]
MNCGCNFASCNPFGCGGCSSCGSAMPLSSFGCNSGCSWFAIVLVVFLLLIICGNSRIHP